MHPEAFRFIAEAVKRLPPRQIVLEYGGRDINGSVRSLFSTPHYLSIDLVGGSGVDLVADASTFDPKQAGHFSGQHPDTVVCCEVLEHTPKWPAIIAAAGKILDPTSGVLLLTCATSPRTPHSAIDGGQVRPGEYYRNVDPMDLTVILDSAFAEYEMDVDDKRGDLRLIAWKCTP